MIFSLTRTILLPLVLVVFFGNKAFAQFMEVGTYEAPKEESIFSIQTLKRFNVSANSFGMADANLEVLRFKYSRKRGIHSILSVSTTRIFLFANKNDKVNTLSQLLLPNSGLINGSFFTTLPLETSKNTKILLTSQLGMRWIRAEPLVQKNKNNFLNKMGSLGVRFQRILFENPLRNQRIFFWAIPHTHFNHSSVTERELFFEQDLKPFAWGYGLEVGIDVRPSTKGSLQFFVLANKLQNPNNTADLGKWCVRATLLYVF